MVMHKACCISEDIVVHVGVFQGRMCVVVDSVHEEYCAENNRQGYYSGCGIEEAG
jgi:hypothetical protein